MQDEQKTRGLLIAELQDLRKRHATAVDLLQTGVYVYTRLSFDHASRRGWPDDVKRFMEQEPPK